MLGTYIMVCWVVEGIILSSHHTFLASRDVMHVAACFVCGFLKDKEIRKNLEKQNELILD